VEGSVYKCLVFSIYKQEESFFFIYYLETVEIYNFSLKIPLVSVLFLFHVLNIFGSYAFKIPTTFKGISDLAGAGGGLRLLKGSFHSAFFSFLGHATNMEAEAHSLLSRAQIICGIPA
jgi:hypothetical protein